MARPPAGGNMDAYRQPATPPPDHGLESASGFKTTSGATQWHQYIPAFTAGLIAATGPNAHPRLAQLMPSFLALLHDFLRKNDVTVDEFLACTEFLNECGRKSDDTRNETQLVGDILGVESLCDENTSRVLAGKAGNRGIVPTPSAVLGPFYREGAPLLPNGACIAQDPNPSADPATNPWILDSTLLHGRVVSATTGLPIAGATLDIWHTAPNGLYEQQDPHQANMNLRGKFTTDADGRYSLYCLKPVAYPVPVDGPAGKLLMLLDRPIMRPAHIHFVVESEGYRTLTTQVYDSQDEFLDRDAVAAVKQDLIVDFLERKGDGRARWELEYDFVLDEIDG